MGDSFEVETADGGRRSLTLTGITENYVFTRLYLSQAQLKTLNGGALPAWNAVYGQTDCPTDAARTSLSSAILACNYVSSVSFIEDTTQMFDGLIGCLNYVVMLVIVCAAALAAVVLYNLISVNLGERKRSLPPSRCWASMTRRSTATSSGRSTCSLSSAPWWVWWWAFPCTSSSSALWKWTR